MIKIAVIDDEKPARSELIYLISEVIPEAKITEIESGEKALELIAKNKYNLLFIDIDLGDLNGTTLAVAARKLQPEVEIVFATAYNNYAEKAFEVEAMYYLLKPFTEAKVQQMFKKYWQKHEEKSPIDNITRTKISINVEKKIILVDISSIVYIESQNRMCIIHTKEKDYKDNNALSYYEEKLADNGFFRIQKSFLINMNHVLELYPWFNNTYCVRMDGFYDEILPVSRGQVKNLKNYLSI